MVKCGVDVASLLIELYGRIPPLVEASVDDLDPERLLESPSPGANPIGWLVWHLTRIQDDHVADLLDEEQLWVTGDWAGRFGLEPDPSNTGFGHDDEAVRAVRPESAGALVAVPERGPRPHVLDAGATRAPATSTGSSIVGGILP